MARIDRGLNGRCRKPTAGESATEQREPAFWRFTLRAMFRRKPAQPAPIDRWLVIGLGNPGREYERSRHNVGFLVVDELARRRGGRVTDRAAKSLTGRVRSGEHELVLAKPQTWMNLSGQAAKALRAKYGWPLGRG